MSPEFYAIIGVGASLAGSMVGPAGLILYLIVQVNRRIDRLEDRVDRLEGRIHSLAERFVESIERLREQVHSLVKRVSKLEWMFEAQFGNQPQPADGDEG